MVDKSLFTSKSDEWETPQALYDMLDAEFNFVLDVAASDTNSMAAVYYTKELSCLNKEWGHFHDDLHFFMNPPFSLIKEFMAKAYDQACKGCKIVCLVPARVDTQWWAKYALKAKEIRFIIGRLKFSNANNSAPFPSAIVIFDGKEATDFVRNFPDIYDYFPKVSWIKRP